MKRITLLLIVSCLIGACNQSPEMQAFDKFKKKIPLVKLPYKKACFDTVSHLALNIPDSIFKKYAPEGASGIIGILKDTDYYSVILYSVAGDIQYPVIQTYDPEGTKLNDIGLIAGTCCGSNNSCSGYSWGEITKDLSIVLRDSEKVFKIDTTLKIPKVKFSVINKSEVYAINDTGYIRLKPNQAQAIQQSGL